MLNKSEENSQHWLDKPLASIIKPNTQTLLLILLLAAAIFTRLYILGERVMSHDEINHVYFAWQFYDGGDYVHNPITHGPLQFHLLELSYFLFNDSDVSARIPAAFFSVLTIMFIWEFRRYLGKVGAFAAAALFTISPFMLYYGRYARNEAIAIFFTIATVWAVLRYLDTGKLRFLYYSGALAALHFATKETAFIFTAQLLIFLGLLFIYRISKREWKDENKKVAFLALLGISLLFLLAMVGFMALQPEPADIAAAGETVTGEAIPEEGAAATEVAPGWLEDMPVIMGGVAGLAFLWAFIDLLTGFGWKRLKDERCFEMMLFQLLLVFPQLAAFPAFWLGLPVSDFYNEETILKIIPYLGVFFLFAILIGALWKWTTWLKGAAIYYGIFTFFYTTMFTNPKGVYTGLIGSLGYWLEQHGVERGSQPIYYFPLIQLPMYEYLAVIGTLAVTVIGIIWLIKRGAREGREPLELFEEEQGLDLEVSGEDVDQYPEVEFEVKDLDGIDIASLVAGEDSVREKPPQKEIPLAELPLGYSRLIALALLLFFSFTSIVAYSMVGEKMPWLTVHISWSMVLATGWLIGRVIERLEWKSILSQTGAIALVWFSVALITFFSGIGMIFNGKTPFQGPETEQLANTNIFLTLLLVSFASMIALIKTTQNWEKKQAWRFISLSMIGFLALITARAAFTASYINYDRGVEYLMYAHAARGPKDAYEQIEDISTRLTGGKEIKVAFDNHTMYPFWWYLRHYPNRFEYGENPSVDLREYPLILVGDGNYYKIDPIVRDDYVYFEYVRMVWPNQDYFDLNYYKGFLSDPATRTQMLYALFEVWLNRDFTAYGQVTGKSISDRYWTPSQTFRLYIRKDVVYQIWEYGSSPGGLELMVDEYAEGYVPLQAAKTYNDMGLNAPRGVASAPDGGVYVADSGNNRILHIDANGIIIGQVGVSGSGPGQFNEPWGVAVDSVGNVYVADTWNHRIQKFTPNLEYITGWGSYGQAETPDAFWGPRDVAIDLEGHVLVSDTGNKRIVVFDAGGEFVGEFGEAGYLSGQLEEPVGVAVSPIDNAIFVADTWNRRVQVFETSPLMSGMYISTNTWDIDGWFGQSLQNKPYLTIDERNNVIVADPENARVLIFSSDGTFVGYFGEHDEFGETGFGLISGLAADGQGGLWVTDSVKNELKYFVLPR